MPAVVNPELCIGCEACVGVCPVEVIEMQDGKAFVNEGCIDCGACEGVCPTVAITME
jgi:NAD-dependent dihydropyrimidine dehydrogenase PreA subunit